MISNEITLATRRMMQRCYPWVVIGVAFPTVAVAFGAIIGAIALFIGAGTGLVLGWAAWAAIPQHAQKGSLTAGL